MKKRDHFFFLSGLLFGSFFIVFAMGSQSNSSLFSKYEKLNVFSEVLHYLEKDYVHKLAPNKLIHNAIHGMLKKLDPYTVFTPAKEYQALKTATSGEFGGIGIFLRWEKNNKEWVVHSLHANSPASRSALRVGDVLLQIEKTKTNTLQSKQIYELLRGVPGSSVKILTRNAKKKEVWSSFVREQIVIKSVISRELEKGYLYTRIRSFQSRTYRQFLDTIDAYKSKQTIQGMIIDLRDNPGGLVEPCVQIADLFLKQGLIVYSRGRHGTLEDKNLAHVKNTLADFPVVILLNDGSASASEIVAGALQDHRRAVLIGSTSYGKGSVQNIFELSDGSGFKMTIARYFTPLGRLLDRVGLQPDIEIQEGTKKLYQKLIQKSLEVLKSKSLFQKSLGKGLPKVYKKRFPSPMGTLPS